MDKTIIHCSDCNALCLPNGVATGYAMRKDGAKICYECADKEQRAMLLDRSAPFVGYISRDSMSITSWSGGKLMTILSMHTVRHNMARSMVAVRAQDCHGGRWYGRGLGDGMCIKLRPCK